MKKAATLAAVAVVMLGTTSVVAGGSGSRVQRLAMRVLPTHGYYVDNDPAGQSGGDLFGSSGLLRRSSKQIGRFSRACTAAPPVGAQCQVTLILKRRGRVQLAGNWRTDKTHNVLSIVGGAGSFRGARGTARVQNVTPDGSIQQMHLRVLR
jgi:hypothetical protein